MLPKAAKRGGNKKGKKGAKRRGKEIAGTDPPKVGDRFPKVLASGLFWCEIGTKIFFINFYNNHR